MGKDGNIQDQNGHGTFVAGVVGAMTNNGLGVTGINQVKGRSEKTAHRTIHFISKISKMQACFSGDFLRQRMQMIKAEHWVWFVMQYASLVGCRFMDATGNGWVSDAIRCFEYCLSKDTQVLSNSWGGVDYSKSLQVQLS